MRGQRPALALTCERQEGCFFHMFVLFFRPSFYCFVAQLPQQWHVCYLIWKGLLRKGSMDILGRWGVGGSQLLSLLHVFLLPFIKKGQMTSLPFNGHQHGAKSPNKPIWKLEKKKEQDPSQRDSWWLERSEIFVYVKGHFCCWWGGRLAKYNFPYNWAALL